MGIPPEAEGGAEALRMAVALNGKLPEVIKLRVASRMHTAHAKYQWMNRQQFIQFGDAKPSTLTVRYDVYAMK